MHQTRQFTKRRPQSPLTTQQHSIDALQIGANKLPRSGLAIQSNAPTHITQRSTPVHTEAEHHQVISKFVSSPPSFILNSYHLVFRYQPIQSCST